MHQGLPAEKLRDACAEVAERFPDAKIVVASSGTRVAVAVGRRWVGSIDMWDGKVHWAQDL